MTTVIPVSSHDSARLPWLVDVLIHLQGLQGHEILIFTTPSVIDVARAQADRLRSVCGQVDVAAMEIEPSFGWPVSPNLQWYAAVNHLHSINHRSGWFWMEVDCVPRLPGWADALANAYVSGGRPFCGNVVNTPYRDAQGNIMPTPHGDTMMIGCSIYPPMMPKDLEIGPLFLDIGKTPPFQAEQPWDIYLRWVMKRRGVAHTPIVADMWSTCNYRQEGGQLVCDPVAVDPKLRGRAVGGVVPAEAVLIHGCKDRSLYDLITGRKEASLVAATEQCADAKVTTGPAPDVAPLPGPEGVPGDDPILDGIDDSNLNAQNGPPGPSGATIEDNLRAVLESWEGTPSLKRVADRVGVAQAQVREMLPTLGWEVRKGPAGWLGRVKEVVV